MKKRIIRCLFVSAALLFVALGAAAQSAKTHKVKKNETIYGIARSYGLTEDELRRANPGMERSDYVLKKGDKIVIPDVQSAALSSAVPSSGDIRLRPIRMGVMLPLHNENGDGRRMVEYYRGLLMACDSLKRDGISVDVYAWNTPENGDISQTLEKPEAAMCDVIFGPLYSKQMDRLSAFCQQNGTMLVIPFSINAPQLGSNKFIFQVYQSPEGLVEPTAHRFAEWFKDRHPVIVDCDNSNSTKGKFTTAVRKEFSSRHIDFSLTSLKSAGASFASAFSTLRPNIVILNSDRASDLEAAIAKLKELLTANPGISISFFGYSEWMSLLGSQKENFHLFDMYIPSTFYTGLSPQLQRKLTQKYTASFKQDMMDFTPPLALTGFDHAFFFLRGLHKYGMTFDGAAGRFGYIPVQTPLKFERVGNGGRQNRAFMFVHFKKDGQVETITY